MRWLVRLLTPQGGLVLDPFTGSGSTGAAAVLEGSTVPRDRARSDLSADRARSNHILGAPSTSSQQHEEGDGCSPPGRRSPSPPREGREEVGAVASEQHEPILVSKALAARLLSISIDSFERTVMPDLRNVRIGRRVLFAVADLGDWVEEHAAVPLVSEMPQHACETARGKSLIRGSLPRRRGGNVNRTTTNRGGAGLSPRRALSTLEVPKMPAQITERPKRRASHESTDEPMSAQILQFPSGGGPRTSTPPRPSPGSCSPSRSISRWRSDARSAS